MRVLSAHSICYEKICPVICLGINNILSSSTPELRTFAGSRSFVYAGVYCLGINYRFFVVSC